jgi:hypothetical protein
MNSMEKDPLETELMRYENKWVAILQPERRVVGSGDTAYDAKIDAEHNGYPETALFMVRPPGRHYVLACSPGDIPVPDSHLELAEESLQRYREDPTKSGSAFEVLDRLANRAK